MEKQNYQYNQLADTEQAQNNTEPKKKRKWLKIIIWFFGIIIFLVVLFFSTPKFLSMFWGKDNPPPNDQDLLLSVVNIHKDENSYFDLLKLSDVSNGENKTEALIKIEIPKEINDLEYLDSYDWDEGTIINLLKKNNEALQIYSTASTKPSFQYDLTADPSNIDLEMPIISLNKWRQVARISSIKAIYLIKQRKDEEAFNEAMKSIIVGHKIKESKNLPLIVYLVGISIKQAGLETMQILISHTSLSPEILNKFQNELRKYHSINNGDIFRGEYLNQKKGIEYINAGLFGELEKKLAKNSFYYKPNQTLELAANHSRQQIERFNKPCSDKAPIIIDEPKALWKLYFTENAIGKLLSSMAVTALESVRNKKCDIDILVNANDILFALKKYRFEKNTYPDKLENLTDEYTSKLPPDPYSGNNFLYNKDKKIIYSIGKNYNDDGGGNIDKKWYLMDDPSFSYDFTTTQLNENITKKTSEEKNDNISADKDNDGLPDEEEIKLGTNPEKSDTDGDGYTDGEEVSNGYDPFK